MCGYIFDDLYRSIIEDSGAHDDILDHENYMLLYTLGGITRFTWLYKPCIYSMGHLYDAI